MIYNRALLTTHAHYGTALDETFGKHWISIYFFVVQDHGTGGRNEQV